ncbi:2TM domain-containing protein [Zunongwangia sp. HGR-M22]|uniref:2TM domain-containing protein n=1 Tax=Zunongwangia sp. HGR-M22 TaxID=3015168 RepID=UPI0022DD2695|nr:2TM domain-containing protein [Zunongwangia sp. HGR-M22]WBL27107.1 2TM domain-containing protein [Zunongwangia sp. HGR-M22]
MRNSEEKYLSAREKMRNIKKFYAHAISFILFNIVFLSLNYYENYIEFPEVLWGTFGWSIGLAFDYMQAFDKNPFLRKGWEERKMKEILDK